jgi:hypothetical protein
VQKPSFTERHWRNLLADIEARQVIPVVGQELLVLPDNGGQTTLYDLLARELLARFSIDKDRLPPDYDLFDVTSLYLQDPANEPEDLHYEARAVLTSRAWPTPEPLKKLAAITHFDLFVSVTVDSLLEQALNEARFGGANSTRSLAYSEKSQLQDIPPDGDAAGPPTVFQLFGKLNATGDYAITEEKVLEFSHRVQSRDMRPKNLFDALRVKNLLAMGCSLPGWLARFFLRATKGDQLYTQGSRGVIVDRDSQRDQDLVMFLERRKTAIYSQGDAPAFVDELHRRWTEQFGQKQAPVVLPTQAAPEPEMSVFKIDSVFISYASEDRTVAQQVKQAFDEAGVDVWYDQRALASGDDYRAKIEKNIESCSYFVPLLSRNTAGEERRFFRLEWFKAIDEMKFRPPEFPFIQPILIDDTPLDAPGIPREFTSRHIRRIDALAELVDDAKRRIRERRRERRSA